jgi:transcriptional regulator GlxA family with amidase domain
MNRREVLGFSAGIGIAGGAGIVRSAIAPTRTIADEIVVGDIEARPSPLPPPAAGPIPVAVPISDGTVALDICGPWSVFDGARRSGAGDALFRLYTVAEGMEVITASAGMRLVPNYTFETAPLPRVIVVPGQAKPGEKLLNWVRDTSPQADVTISICTGAFVLAHAGLLNGKPATTHHNAYADLSMEFPDIVVKRGMRFVETGNLATSGGGFSGVDLSLRVVERYFGKDVAAETALRTEYQGTGWLDANSNQIYRKRRVSTAANPLCPVCEMTVDPRTAPTSVYLGRRYYFCMPSHRVAFDAAPPKYLDAA